MAPFVFFAIVYRYMMSKALSHDHTLQVSNQESSNNPMVESETVIFFVIHLLDHIHE